MDLITCLCYHVAVVFYFYHGSSTSLDEEVIHKQKASETHFSALQIQHSKMVIRKQVAIPKEGKIK